MADLPRPLTTTSWEAPAFTASSTMSCRVGVSTMGSSSFGTALVAGRKRVPRPAAGVTTLREGGFMPAGDGGKGFDQSHPALRARDIRRALFFAHPPLLAPTAHPARI